MYSLRGTNLTTVLLCVIAEVEDCLLAPLRVVVEVELRIASQDCTQGTRTKQRGIHPKDITKVVFYILNKETWAMWAALHGSMSINEPVHH